MKSCKDNMMKPTNLSERLWICLSKSRKQVKS
nr:MAG TPA: hypothetical protein [Caudoviricetes sp.]